MTAVKLFNIIAILRGISEIIDENDNMRIRSKDKLIDFNLPEYPDKVVYFTKRHIYIPERLLDEKLDKDALNTDRAVDYLYHESFKKKQFLTEDALCKLEVNTPAGKRFVDAVEFNIGPILKLYKKEEEVWH